MVTDAIGANPLPMIFTEVPTGPEFGLSVMAGTLEDVTVNGFESDFDPWVATTVLISTR